MAFFYCLNCSTTKTIGISECQLTKATPEKLKTSLPTVREIEVELHQFASDEKDKKA